MHRRRPTASSAGGRSADEELEEINPVTPLYGPYYQIGFTNNGAKILEQLKDLEFTTGK